MEFIGDHPLHPDPLQHAPQSVLLSGQHATVPDLVPHQVKSHGEPPPAPDFVHHTLNMVTDNNIYLLLN